VNPSVPARTIPEPIGHAKANPGRINYGSAGRGTPQNISCELFKMMTAVDRLHVPYRGGALAINDLISGHLQVTFAPVSKAIQQIKAGKLRALAVTTRLDVFPDVPPMADFVPGYEASGFAGLAAPTIKTRIVKLGGTVVGGSPQEFGAIISEATEKRAKVIKFAGIKAEQIFSLDRGPPGPLMTRKAGVEPSAPLRPGPRGPMRMTTALIHHVAAVG